MLYLISNEDGKSNRARSKRETGHRLEARCEMRGEDHSRDFARGAQRVAALRQTELKIKVEPCHAPLEILFWRIFEGFFVFETVINDRLSFACHPRTERSEVKELAKPHFVKNKI